MNQKEIDRLIILNKLIERSLTQKEAVDKLKISDLQIRNLLKNYTKLGVEAAISKKKESQVIERKIVF